MTPRASLLLDQIALRIAEESPAAAGKLVTDLLDAAETLTTLFDRGRKVPELGDSEYRELLIREYRLIYRMRPDEVQVIGIVHGARDFRSWWRRLRWRRV